MTSSNSQSSSDKSSNNKSSNSKSQWNALKENIGVWYGSFEQYAPNGELVKDTPSVLTLAEENEQTLALTLERMPAGEPKKVNNLTFTYPGPAPYTYFFASGAFSQGSSQWSSFGQFVTEFSMKVRDRRIRFVIAYDSTQSYTSALKYVTLICETQEGGAQFNKQSPNLQQLSGAWQGEGEILDPITGSFSPQKESIWMLLKPSEAAYALRCEEQVGESYAIDAVSVESTENADGAAAVTTFESKNNAQQYQLMQLSKGAYCFLPKEIRQNDEFRIEVGWVSEQGERSRFIRYYDTRGVWTHSALIHDQQIKNEQTNIN